MKKLLVSIIINNYNYGRYLSDAINSALNQTYPYVEVVVVDDGSTDNSRDIITSYSNEVVPVLKENGGHGSALNAGFAASKGNIICFLDSDDIFLPEKVEKVLEAFESSPDIGWCFHPLHILDMSKSECASINLPTINFSEKPLENIDFRLNIKDGKQPNFVPQCSAICFSRSLLDKIFPMPEDIKIYVGDTYLSMIAVYLSKGCLLSNELTIYRVHGNNAYARNTIAGQRESFSRLHIVTGYWLRGNFPEIAKYSNVFFAKGLGTAWLVEKLEPRYKKFIQDYLGNTSWLEKLKIYLRAFYYYSKSVLLKRLP